MLFQPKEHGSMGPSGEDLIPVWSRIQQRVEESGFRGYLTTLFHAADVMATLGDTDEWRESEIMDVKGKDFYDPTFAMIITQMSLKALVAGQPPYYHVRISFHYELNGQHTMEISGQEQTYKGVLPKSFHGESEEIQQVQDGLVQAMLRPEVVAPDAKV